MGGESQWTVQELVRSCGICPQKEVLHGCHDFGSHASDLCHCTATARGVLWHWFAQPILAQSRVYPVGLCAGLGTRLPCASELRPRTGPIASVQAFARHACPAQARGSACVIMYHIMLRIFPDSTKISMLRIFPDSTKI